jgi:hypothetical protein
MRPDVPNAMGTASTQPAWLGELVNVLDQQREMLARVDDLGRQIGPLVEKDDSTGVLVVLASRERLIGELRVSSQSHAPLVAQWHQWRGAISEADRRLVQHRLDDIAWLQNRLVERDEADRRRLEARRDEVANEIAKLNTGNHAAAAYGTTTAAPTRAADLHSPRFQDREC